MSISNYSENKLLDALFRHTTTGGGLPTANPFVSLHTADPGDTGANEVAGGSYARQQAAFDAAVSGATQNTAAIDFSGLPAATITHFAIWDAVTVGNCLWSGALDVSVTVLSGGVARFALADLDISID